MARSHGAAHKPVVHEPEEDTQEAPDTENESQDDESGKLTKAEAVRRAVAAGYPTAKTGVPYIKEQFGIDIDGSAFAANKAAEKRRHGGDGGGTDRQHDTKGKPPAAGMPQGLKGVGAHLKIIKGLLDNYDADELKTLFGDVQSMIDLYGVSGTNEMIDLVTEMQAE